MGRRGPQCGPLGHTGGQRRRVGDLGTLGVSAAVWTIWARWGSPPQCGQFWAHWGPAPQCGQSGHTGGQRSSVGNLGTLGVSAAVWAIWAHWGPAPQCGQFGHTGGQRRSVGNLGTLGGQRRRISTPSSCTRRCPMCRRCGHTRVSRSYQVREGVEVVGS